MSASREVIEGFQAPTGPAEPEVPLWVVAVVMELFVEILALNALHGRIGRDTNQLLTDIRDRLITLHNQSS